jgi:hypothetical protein
MIDIMTADHSFHHAITAENIQCVIDKCIKYGKYPLDLDIIKTRISDLKNKKNNVILE